MSGDEQKKNCLILIPKEGEILIPEKDEMKKNGGIRWEKVSEAIWGKRSTEKSGYDTCRYARCFIGDEPREPVTYVFYSDHITGEVELKESHSHEDKKRHLGCLITALYSIFEEKKEDKKIDIESFSKVVLCGHFHVDISKVRDLCNKIYKDMEEKKEDTKKIEWFRKAINGEDDKFVIARYSVGASKLDKGSELIKSLEEVADAESIKQKFSEIFNYYYVTGRWIESLSDLKTQLFIHWQSNGKCGSTNEIQDSLRLINDYSPFAKPSFDDDAMNKFIKGDVKSGLTQEQKSEIGKWLDDMIETAFGDEDKPEEVAP